MFTGDQKIRAGFLLLTLLTFALGGVAISNALALVAASKDVARTNDMVKKLEIFLSRLKDVEVAQREYVITGDDTYLQEIVRARAEIESRMQRLSDLRADQHWVELLKTLVPEKFDEIQRTVDLRREGNIEAASNSMLINRGYQSMDDIRRVVNRMITEENLLLGQRSRDQNAKFVSTMLIFGSVLVLNVILTWSLFYTVRRESQHVRKLNEELERRVAERTSELERSNDELQQFAYAASHDLKEPMRMISSYASLLQRRYEGQLGKDADTYIGFIVDGVKRMNALIIDLLDFARAGQAAENEGAFVDPKSVIRTVLDNLKVLTNDTAAAITQDNLPPVTYDPVRLGQVFQNLISNAIKYRGDRKPVIHIGAQTTDREIVFFVRDNGIGIPPEHQGQIFGIFKRLHGKDVEGTGIGLATCKRIVEQRGGRIWVESVPGQGSTFRFTVPNTQVEAKSAATSS